MLRLLVISRQHALKRIALNSAIVALTVALFFLCSACSRPVSAVAEKLNSKAYAFHYRNLDSVVYYSEQALKASDGDDQSYSEAQNNLAFASIARMHYSDAARRLEDVLAVTDNQVELLVADVQMMRLCQRESRNKEFYDYHEQALQRIIRIRESYDELTPHQAARMAYANSEFLFVSSAYYYYLGQKDKFVKALSRINADELLHDTAQYLNYLYNVGAGDYLRGPDRLGVAEREMDCLLHCYVLSADGGYTYWQAQALQAFSEHLQDRSIARDVMRRHRSLLYIINTDDMPDGLLAGNLAQRSQRLFAAYGDVYQSAGANRTLASCFFNIADYKSSLICLNNALYADTAIMQAPDLVASIREQLCMTYSALDDKRASDYNRNIYLDLQEDTRQDRLLESRAAQLRSSSVQLNVMIVAILILIIVLMVMLLMVNRHHMGVRSLEPLLKPLERWKEEYHNGMTRDEEECAQLTGRIEEEQALTDQARRRLLEHRAKISLVTSVTPFIDRMLHEIKRLRKNNETADIRRERFEYVGELLEQINRYNKVLTDWIQMRRGELSINITSFQLEDVLKIVRGGITAYKMQGVELDVPQTDVVVKADKTLTMFMINTIADNARKFTPRGGRISISVTKNESYAEISVADNGCGMDSEQVSHLFDRTYTGGHGFGLLNCKGIIEKYKKTSSLFSVCDIFCRSDKGRGTVVSFRLPVGRRRMVSRTAMTVVSVALLLAMPLMMSLNIHNDGNIPAGRQNAKTKTAANTGLAGRDSDMTLAEYYAGKAYSCNVNLHFDSTMAYSDSALTLINRRLAVSGTDTLRRLRMVRLSVYNETAVAALALHKWDTYRKYNKAYTDLFNVLSTDNTLAHYVRSMQKSEGNKQVAVVILVLLLLLIIPLYYFMYYRRQLYFRYCVDCVNSINGRLLAGGTAAEKLTDITAMWQKALAGRDVIGNNITDSLSVIVKDITETLRRAVAADGRRLHDKEALQERVQRLEYENGRYHVSNAILDNCLSALKHETMYYPSRIMQIIKGGNVDLEQVYSLAAYYKDLYSMLSLQAVREASRILLVIDKNALDGLFDILSKAAGSKVDVRTDEMENGYVRLSVSMGSLSLSEKEAAEYFTPLTVNLDMLLCRQMIRDVGEATNMRGCGITAVRSSSGNIVIEIIIPKKIWSILK